MPALSRRHGKPTGSSEDKLDVPGAGWGESSKPKIGAGIEARVPGRRLGFRATVEDYLVRTAAFDCAAFGFGASECNGSRGRSSTHHQLGVRLGILF
jgi:hypothetical protein